MDLEAVLENFEAIAELPDAAKKIRATILNLAVQGQLVSQDPDDQSAVDLVRQIQLDKGLLDADIFADDCTDPGLFALPSNWTWARIEEISSYVQQLNSPGYSESGEVIVLSQECNQWEGIDLSKGQYAEGGVADYPPNRILRKGDLLWNCWGSGTIGRIGRFPDELDVETPKYIAGSKIAVIRVMRCVPKYIYYWLLSPFVQEHIPERTRGAVKPQINITTARSELVPLPPLKEQERIVAKVDALLGLCDRYKAIKEYRDALQEELCSAKFTD